MIVGAQAKQMMIWLKTRVATGRCDRVDGEQGNAGVEDLPVRFTAVAERIPEGW